jgi:hypothetical protein
MTDDEMMPNYRARIRIAVGQGLPIPLYAELERAGALTQKDRYGNPVIKGLSIIGERIDGYYPCDYDLLRKLELADMPHEFDMNEASLTTLGSQALDILRNGGYDFRLLS